MTFLCYSKCSTCAKARKWLEDHRVDYTARDIKEENPSEDELARWLPLSGAPLRRFFNTTGMKYRALELKDRLPEMSEKEQLELLATDGMLVKRPLLIGDNFVLIGFNEGVWEQRLRPYMK